MSPLKEESVNHGFTVTTWYGELRHVPGAGWLPFLMAQQVGKRIRRITILDTDFHNPPSPGDLSLDFAEPVSVVDHVRRLAYPPSRRISLKNLPARSAPGVSAISPVAASSPVLPAESQAINSAPLLWGGLASAIVIVAGGLAITYYLRNRS
jgi:hypothetical protein